MNSENTALQLSHARLLSSYAFQQNMHADLLSLMVFTHLPTEYVQRITTFTEDDWLNYARLRELEVLGNRPHESDESKYAYESDDPRGEQVETLPEHLFARWNEEPRLTYPLYVAMSEAEHLPKDALFRRIELISSGSQ